MANHLEQLAKSITEEIVAHLHDFDTLSMSLSALDEDDQEDLRRSITCIIENALYAESERW